MDRSDNELLKKCLCQIENKLGWGNSEHWHSGTFRELSGQIHQVTGVLLSVTTLKRLWGRVSYKSVPSMGTLNVIAEFAGYSHWLDYINKTNIHHPKSNKRQLSNQKIIIISSVAIALVLLSLFSMIGSEKIEIYDFSKAQFSSQPLAQGIPNSVIFNLNLHGIDSDSIYIQQYWDPAKTIKINSGQQQATGIYYLPGYFNAKLWINGTVVKSHELFIKSKGWLATIDYVPVPKYLTQRKILTGKLALPLAIRKEISENEKPLSSTYHLVEDFGKVSADNFHLTTTLKNVLNEKWAVCETTQVIILGTSGAMIIPFSIPGCVSDLGIMLNDIYYKGKEHDLSAFGIDLSNNTQIKIIVKNKNVNVLVRGKEIYKGSYHTSMGKLAGIRFKFIGAGEVDSLMVTSGGKTVIEI